MIFKNHNQTPNFKNERSLSPSQFIGECPHFHTKGGRWGASGFVVKRYLSDFWHAGLNSDVVFKQKSRIEFPDPMFMTLDTPLGPNAKVLKKMTGKCGKNLGKNYFPPTLVFDLKTRLQLRYACKKSERNL